jgi:molecular chaperone DnaJ
MDPYQILGVSYDATDDDIKKAYRILSRKYHPDANINNPDKAQAEEKFKQVQEAYNVIMNQRQNKNNGYGYSYSNRNPGSGDGNNTIDMELRAAANYIRSGYYREAANTLESIESGKRNGMWYYLSALCAMGRGETDSARSYINQAVAMEPGNFQFRQLQRQIDMGMGMGSQNNWYETRGQNYGRTFNGGSSNWCLDMLLLNLFCNFCLC